VIDATLNLFLEMMRKDPTPSVRQAGEDAVRLSREELDQLRADLARVTEERDAETAIASEALRNQGRFREERDAARAETTRLRERVQSLAAWLAEPGRYVTPKRAAELVQALTSDPEPTT
jgi:hypothetical protein